MNDMTIFLGGISIGLGFSYLIFYTYQLRGYELIKQPNDGEKYLKDK